MSKAPRLFFVCLGNICRSPVAEGVMRARAKARGIQVEVASAGTGGWHVGGAADKRMTAAAALRGYDLSAHRAQQADTGDFYVHDMIFAMDSSNHADLLDIRPPDATANLQMFLARTGGGDVPDPYYGGPEGFDHVIDLVEEAVDAILNDIEAGR
ncbi:low molecular weight protein-tyrosine-phosphatase [Parvularcula marina]|uniref:low molecular weight protein-tyrosine-phosphatase n=1 Tax=Parvularcula marina TaxID=2292771 RepID=UPI003513427B